MKFFSSLIVFILFATACRQAPSTSKTIEFWALGAEGEFVQKLLPDFYALHPEMTVNIQMIPWTAAQEKLITAFASGNLPDVFQLGNTWIPQFSALFALEDLGRWVDSSKVINRREYFEGIWDTNMMDGRLYGIPWYIDTRVLFYRTDVLRRAGYDTAPRTWDDFLDVSRKIKLNAAGKDRYAVYLPTNEWAPFVIFGLQSGSSLLRDHESYGNFSSEKFLNAFTFLINMIQSGLSPMGVTQVTNVYQAFAEEYFVMYISGPWNIPEFKRWMTGDLRDQWSTAPLPGPDESTPGVSLAGGSSLVMSRLSQNKSGSWTFIEFLSLPEIQIKFYNLLNDLPAVKSAWQDSSLANDPYMKAFFQQFHHVVATPKVPEWEQIAFAKIQLYAELAARGKLTPAEALSRLDKDVNRILEKRRWLLSKEVQNENLSK